MNTEPIPNLWPGCTARELGQWLPVAFLGGSGGFTSYVYPQPSYQAGVVPASLSERNPPIKFSGPARVEPDISLLADPSAGFVIGFHQMLPDGQSQYTTTRYGGTSVSVQLLAGMLADADQAASKPLGFINPALYRMKSHKPSSINDTLPPGDLRRHRQLREPSRDADRRPGLQQFDRARRARVELRHDARVVLVDH